MTARTSTWLLAAAAALWLAPARAADLEVPTQRKPAPSSVNVFAPPDATCVEWTDGCRTCQKPATGEVTCSNVGIACVVETPRCRRR